MAKNIIDLNNGDYSVVDLDTGTVLGTNVILVPVPKDEEEWEAVLSNDSQAVDYAQKHGIAMYSEV